MDLHETAKAYLEATDQSKNLELSEMLFNEIKTFLRNKFWETLPESMMEDVLQNTLLAVFQDFATYRGKTESQFKAWCKTIFFYKKSDMWRDRYAARMSYLEPEILLSVIDESGEIEPFQPGERLDLENTIAHLKKLKPGCLELLWKIADGMKLREIRKQMNLKSDTVRMRINRCKNQAKRCLKQNRT